MKENNKIDSVVLAAEDAFLAAALGDVNIEKLPFKYIPTYIVYMSARHKLNSAYRPDMSANERLHQLTVFIDKVANVVYQIVQVRKPF